MKKHISFAVLALVSLTFTSCYKILRTSAPEEAVAGETFNVTVTVGYDGDANSRYKKDWSLAGVRVPEGWTVTAPAMNHRAYAEDWVYYEDGSLAAKKYPMSKNESLSKIYNDACPKTGYEWFGFQSRVMVPKNLTACWRNGCDSIVGTFKVEVPADCAPGVYTIDFIAGDEEDEAGAAKYTSYKDALSTRVFEAGTFSFSSFNRVNTLASKTIVIKADPTAVNGVSVKEETAKETYTIDGVKVKKPHRGINIVGGKKVIR